MCITSFGIFSCNKKRALKAIEEIVNKFLHMITNFMDIFNALILTAFNISKTEIIVHFHSIIMLYLIVTRTQKNASNP